MLVFCAESPTKDYETSKRSDDSHSGAKLKKGQGHQAWYELADPKQGYNNAKFEKLRLNSVREKPMIIFLVRSGNMSMIFLEMCKRKKKKRRSYIHHLLDVLNNPTMCVNWIKDNIFS